MLVHHYQHFAENLSIELPRKEFQRMKADEGEEARGQAVPRMPSKAERQAHELTRYPYQPRCQHCIAGRGRVDYHLSEKHAARQEAKADTPVISMDFCLSRGDDEVGVEVKEDLRIYQGDLRGGIGHMLFCECQHHGKAGPASEQVMKFIGSLGYSRVIFKGDGEPSMRMLVEVLQQARLRLGFYTNIDISGLADSQANGRVEREIQTVRGMARTLHGVKEGCQMHIKPSSPVFPHFRRQGEGPWK